MLSNTKAYASRKQVSNAMREVHQTREGGEGAAPGTAGGGSASAAGEESSRFESSGGTKGKQRVTKGKGGDDEQDLRSLKRSEEEVLSVTR